MAIKPAPGTGNPGSDKNTTARRATWTTPALVEVEAGTAKYESARRAIAAARSGNKD